MLLWVEGLVGGRLWVRVRGGRGGYEGSPISAASTERTAPGRQL